MTMTWEQLVSIQPGIAVVPVDTVYDLPLSTVDWPATVAIQPGIVKGSTPPASGCPWYADLKSGACVTPSRTLLIGAAVAALVLVVGVRS
jgi:hypothetical protein